ncbi:hypothetical protein Mapa_003902 [Marchantia paleacea]|nr:hypothetical protein Mapa_003902 [Marchantia paleacea]
MRTASTSFGTVWMDSLMWQHSESAYLCPTITTSGHLYRVSLRGTLLLSRVPILYRKF